MSLLHRDRKNQPFTYLPACPPERSASLPACLPARQRVNRLPAYLPACLPARARNENSEFRPDQVTAKREREGEPLITLTGIRGGRTLTGHSGGTEVQYSTFRIYGPGPRNFREPYTVARV